MADFRPNLCGGNSYHSREFEHRSAEQRKVVSYFPGEHRQYSGGGYVLKLTGYIGDLVNKVKYLQDNNWINNRTRAVITEFSVYNAQVDWSY